MSEYPEKLKHELVLWFKYRRVGAVWSRAGEPEVLRVATQDCSQLYREPTLVGTLDDGVVEIRLHHAVSIDISNPPSLLGDWRRAERICEAWLESELQKVPGRKNDSVERRPPDEDRVTRSP